MLHGLSWDARNALCAEYRSRLADLSAWSLDQYIEAYFDHTLRMLAFVRPAVIAALDLGVTEFRSALDEGMTANTGELAETLRTLAPQLTEIDLNALARAIRRVAFGLIDREFNGAELRMQLCALVAGYIARAQRVEAVAD